MGEINKIDVPTLIACLEGKLINSSVFVTKNGEPPALKRTFSLHSPSLPVLVVGGENGSGKSILANAIQILARDLGFSHRCVSMSNRTQGGIERLVVYGSEDERNTGFNSAGAAIKGISQSKQSEKPAVLILDEPDVGLSEELCGAMGDLLAQEVMEGGHNLKLLVIISHSRPLYRRLFEALPFVPNSIYLGCSETSFQDWMRSTPKRMGADEVEKMMVKSKETRRAIDRAWRED